MLRMEVLLALLLMGGYYLPTVEDTPSLPGVPISQERHHHLVLENSYFRAY
jgi:hypothetical protein